MQKQFKNLLKGILIYGFGNVSVKLVGLVLLRLYTNPKYLSIEEYAVYGVLEVTTIAITSFFSLALYNAYIRWYWDKEIIDKRKSILFSCFVVLFGMGLLLSLSGLFCSKTLSFLLFGKDTFSLAILLMIVGSSIQFLIDITLTQMRVEEKPTYYITSNILRLIVSLVATVYLLKYAHRGVVGIQEALILGNIAFILITIPYIIKHIELRFNLAIIKDMLKFSLPIATASISGILLNFADRYVLNYRSTALNVGVYTLAYKIANTTKIFVINSIQIALNPTYYKLLNNPDHKAIFSRILTWLTIVVVFSSLFISLFGLEITKLFSTGTIYWDAYKIIPLLSLGIIFAMLKDSIAVGIQVVKKTRIIGITIPIIVVFNIILNAILIPYLGTVGAATASLIAQIVYFIVIHHYVQKYYYIPYRFDKVFIIITISAILFIICSLFNDNSFAIRASIKFTALLIFPILLYLFRVFDKTEINALKSFIISVKGIFGNASPKEVDEEISKVDESQ